jgi:hypothetical protein
MGFIVALKQLISGVKCLPVGFDITPLQVFKNAYIYSKIATAK